MSKVFLVAERELARASKRLMCAPRRQRHQHAQPSRADAGTKRVEAVVSAELWSAAINVAQAQGVTLSKLIADAMRAHVSDAIASSTQREGLEVSQ